MAIKALDHNRATTSTRLISAIDYARTNNVEITSLAVAGSFSSDNLARAIKSAKQSGMLIVSPMGNNNASVIQYPAAYRNLVLSVGALDKTGKRWDDSRLNQLFGCAYSPVMGSNFNASIDLSAPAGRQIATLQRMGSGVFYDVTDSCGGGFGGTSAAVGVVTGVASLLKSFKPELTGEDIEQVLIETARDVFDPINQQDLGWDAATGHGCVDAQYALELVNGKLFQHGIAANGQSEYVWQDISITPYGVPGLNDGQPYQADKHEVEAVSYFPVPYGEIPSMWSRTEGSLGWDHSNPHYAAKTTDGFAEVANMYNNRVTMRTYVYYIRPCIGCAGIWYPTSPGGAKMAWTAWAPSNQVGIGPGLELPHLVVQTLPNPTRHGVEFKVKGAENETIQIQLYDILGRLVWTFGNEAREGEYSVRWDGLTANKQRAAPGMYFYEINLGGNHKSGKIVVVQ